MKHPQDCRKLTSRHLLRRARVVVVIFGLALATLKEGRAADTPVTPHASPEAQSLIAFFADVYGKKTLSGQQDSATHAGQPTTEMDYIAQTSGKLPAIRSFDVMDYTPKPLGWQPPPSIVVERAIEWSTQSNGIVALCWHWFAPTGERAFYSKDTRLDIRRAVTEGTPEFAATLRDLDTVAAELKRLQSAHVPVLWRPLHEASGRWFWWGAQGPEPFRKLWRLMFERFTAQHGLTNLLWVFSPGAATDLAAWYPGDAYVDIIGQDHYPMDGNHGSAKEVFDELVELRRGTKLVGMSENGPIPDPDLITSDRADWLFFTTWNGRSLTEHNPKEHVTKVFQHPHILNLTDLPKLHDYPFPPTGPAEKLGFAALPSEVAVGSPGRLPVVVAVQDATGRTVRDRVCTVTLVLGKSPGGATLEDKLAVTTVNGVATFADVRISRAGTGCTFTATASNLASVVSTPFTVGPGTGLLREWWTDVPGWHVADFTQSARFTNAPTGREILGKAMETPFQTATNFAARYRGWLLPPQTGAYALWLATDAETELWCSTDESPANKAKVAEITGRTPYAKWPHTKESQSSPLRLVAGQRYYLEVLLKQGEGTTHLSLRWRRPDGVEERPIPAVRFALPDSDLPRLVPARQTAADSQPAP